MCILNAFIKCFLLHLSSGGAVLGWLWSSELCDAGEQRVPWHRLEPGGGWTLPRLPSIRRLLQWWDCFPCETTRPLACTMLPSSCPFSAGQVKAWKRTPTSWWGCSFAGQNVLVPPCGGKVGMACCQPWRRPLGFHRICPEMVPLLLLREARHCKTSQPAQSSSLLRVQMHQNFWLTRHFTLIRTCLTTDCLLDNIIVHDVQKSASWTAQSSTFNSFCFKSFLPNRFVFTS